MGFWDRPDTAQEILDKQNTNGKALGEFISGHPVETFIGTVIILAIVVTVIILITKSIKKYNHTNTAICNKHFYTKISKKPIWRLMNVIYWATIVIAVLITFMATDYYGSHQIVGFGVVIGILAYPGYLGLRRIVAYILNPTHEYITSAHHEENLRTAHQSSEARTTVVMERKKRSKNMSLTSMFIIFLIFFVGGQVVRYSVSNLFGSCLIVVSYIFFFIWVIYGVIYLVKKNKK